MEKQSSLWDEPPKKPEPQAPRIVSGPSAESMRVRCAKIDMNWDTLLVSTLKRLAGDSTLTGQELAELNTALVNLEAKHSQTRRKR